MRKLENNTFLVMGASGDIGQAVSARLATEGARLILVGRSCEKLEKIAAVCESHGAHCVVVPATFSTLIQLDELAVHLAMKYGALDAFISCLGYVGSLGPLHCVSEQEWLKTWMVNVTLNWKALQSFNVLLSKGKLKSALFPIESYWLQERAYGSVYSLAKKALVNVVNQFNMDNGMGKVRAHIIPLPLANTTTIDKTFPGLQGTLESPQHIAQLIIEGLADASGSSLGRVQHPYPQRAKSF